MTIPQIRQTRQSDSKANRSIEQAAVYSERPLIFRAQTASASVPQILYVSNRGVDGNGFNLSYKVHEEGEDIAAHHRQLEVALGRPLSLVRQVHSSRVVDLDAYLANAVQGSDSHSPLTPSQLRTALVPLATREADAQVTTRTDIALGVYTADCTPVLLVDAVHGVYGVAHAGRKGVENGVVPETVAVMESKGAELTDVEVWLGPNICGNCYETGDVVAQEFAHKNAELLEKVARRGAGFPAEPDAFVTHTRFGGEGIDMRAALKAQLAAMGMNHQQVHDEDSCVDAQTHRELDQASSTEAQAPNNSMCTLENPLLYSYREWTLTHRPGSNGRFISVLMP
ncbi:MAG: polyphenol oxidase family protein [Bifidobacteriaceae bacterium]|jgi:YfiH family protein|nr:polyphenol oxidase family protein [Bifidobacteriaceae bacterium]MCI1914868.1 polyphenol oxidase family protein [Bifidobacteriaceae bacterium]